MEQVQDQCGKPHFRKFNADVTTWEYRTHSNQRVFLLDFDDDKLEMISTGLRSTAVTCSQVVAMMKLLSFSDAQIKLVSFANTRIADESNSYQIVDAFTFDSDKREAAKILQIRY